MLNDVFILKCLFIGSAIKQDVDEPAVKKMKTEEVDKELEKKIEKQNKEFFKLRDSLETATKKPIHIAILEANKQAIPEGNAEVSEIRISHFKRGFSLNNIIRF